jgi:hypothetical protein
MGIKQTVIGMGLAIAMFAVCSCSGVGGTADGSQPSLKAATDAQLGDGAYSQVQNAHIGMDKCLDSSAPNAAMATCNGSPNQRWATDVPTSSDLEVELDNTIRSKNGSCLASDGKGAGAAVVAAPCADAIEQDWYVWGTNGLYHSGVDTPYAVLANRNSGLCLSSPDDVKLTQEKCALTAKQQWGSPTNAF